MEPQNVMTLAFAIVAVGCILLVVAVPALCLALMRGSVRGALRIAGVIAILAALVFLAALVVGSSPIAYLAT